MRENQYRIRKQTLIEIPHDGKSITFVYDQHGPGNYAGVKKSIEKAELACPTMAETASLVHTAFFANKRKFSEIKKIIKTKDKWWDKSRKKGWVSTDHDKWLWAFTGNLYTPKSVYVQDNPEIREGKPFMEESELIKKLEAKDPSVRFVPFGFKTGRMRPIEMAKNKYVIALAGKEGAEQLAEIADKYYKEDPHLWSFKSVDKPLVTVSALYSWLVLNEWWVGARTFCVVGDTHGYYKQDFYKEGCAFGVQKTKR